MVTLKLLFLVAIIAYSLYSFIVYSSRRSENKAALRTMRDHGTPTRSLTAEEESALAPFLVQPLKPGTAMTLARAGVFVLNGPYRRHGISTSGGGETFHDTIDDIEVILPYDARDHLEPNSRAEVVFTEKYAIVVTLNGTFDLLGARERARRREVQDRQWASGQAGALPDAAPDALDGLKTQGVDVSDAEASMRVEILGQRAETPCEVQARSGPGIGLLPGLGFAIALIGLGAASWQDGASRWWGVAPAVLFGGLAAWSLWSRRGLPEARKVNRVRGHVHAIALAMPGQVHAVPHLFVGDKVRVELPPHWQALCETLPSEPIEVDVRVDDHTAVRFGKALSIDDEVKRVPPVYWGRHLTLAIVGAIGLVLLLLEGSSLRNDMVLTLATVMRQDAQTFDAAPALRARLPEVGTPVQLTGKARCDWGGSPRLEFDCTRLYWGGAAPKLVDVEIDPVTVSFQSGDFLPTRTSLQLELLMQMQRVRQEMADPAEAYRRGLSYGYGGMPATPKIVPAVAEVVEMVEKNCGDATPACDHLKQALAGALKVEEDRQPKDWPGWVRLQKAGELKGDNADALILVNGLSGVQAAAREVANARLASRAAAATRLWREQGSGGVIVSTRGGGAGTELPEVPQVSDAFASLKTAREWAGDDGLKPFTVRGLVVERTTPDGGVPELLVDGRLTLDDPWPSVLRVAFALLAAGLLAVHGIAGVLAWRAASRRARELLALNQARLAKVAFIA